MNLYLLQNEKQTGPFSDDQIREMLRAGSVTPATLSWREGMTSWTPLQGLITPPAAPAPFAPVPPAVPAPRRSILGTVSFIASLVTLPAWFVLLAAAGIAHNNGTATPTVNILVGLFFIGGVLVNFIAMVLGIIAAFKSRANTLAIIGACINGFLLVALVALLLLGLSMRGNG